VRVREALQLSLNIPVVELTEAMGPARVLVAMDKAGVGYRLPQGEPGLAIALGGIGVSLQDMVQLYAALARGGVALPLRWRLEGEGAEGRGWCPNLGLAGGGYSGGAGPAAGRAGEPAGLQDGDELWPSRCLGDRV
jgi:membrane carboxypeptidase/penicillin-binding protein PbpC